MAILKLSADARLETGTRASRALRATGFIPANLYSHGQAPTALKLHSMSWTKALSEEVHLVMLDVPGQKPQVATLREIQRDPLSQQIIHVDLLRIEMDETVQFSVKVDYFGVPKGTKEGGVTQILSSHIEVECLPTNVPDIIRVDISDLDIGGSIHARQLVMPDQVKLITEPDVTLVSVAMVRLVVEKEEVAPTEAVEGEAAGEEGEKTEKAEERPSSTKERPSSTKERPSSTK